MFTGIVQGLAAVAQVAEADNFKSFKIKFPDGKADGIQIGASVAINGTCLTVTAIEQDVLSFDVMSETLRATSLGALKVGPGTSAHKQKLQLPTAVCTAGLKRRKVCQGQPVEHPPQPAEQHLLPEGAHAPSCGR
jgi:hypothetical protein